MKCVHEYKQIHFLLTTAVGSSTHFIGEEAETSNYNSLKFTELGSDGTAI